MHSEGKTMENKLVSVIVPVYNVETYLKRCITSLLAQSYTNTEIILVDDGSTDASGKICDHYAASHPSLICLHQTNQGQSCARNAGMRIAHGDYYMFVDSDDYIEPDMIAAMVAESESRDADIVVCGYWMEYPFLSVRRRMLPKQCWNTKRGLELLQENKRIEKFCLGKTVPRVFARRHCISAVPFRRHLYALPDIRKSTAYRDASAANVSLCAAEKKHHKYKRLFYQGCTAAAGDVRSFYIPAEKDPGALSARNTLIVPKLFCR